MVALPVLAAVGASVAIEFWVARPAGWAQLWWWSTTFAASAVSAAVVERGVRRLTPLATLLRLTLVFPDQAPSRFKIARTAANPGRLAELAVGSDQRSTAAAQVLALMAQLSRHDKLTRGHSERVRVFSDLIADELGIIGPDRDKLRWAALVHDIGKISVPAAVLNKKGRPDPVEWAQIQGHPAAGEAYAGPLFGWLGPWAGAITEHHERWDGTGYPRRIGGNDLTLGGRVVAVADAYETMTAARSYKKALSVEAARRELTNCSGKQFDPDVVRAFLLIGVGRLSRALGPVAWIAHLPFALQLQTVGTRLATSVTAAGPAAALGVGGLATVAATVSGVVPAAAATPVRSIHLAAAHRPAAARLVATAGVAASAAAHAAPESSPQPVAELPVGFGAIDHTLFDAITDPLPASAPAPSPVSIPALPAPTTPPSLSTPAADPSASAVASTSPSEQPPAETPSPAAAPKSPGASAAAAPPVPAAGPTAPAQTPSAAAPTAAASPAAPVSPAAPAPAVSPTSTPAKAQPSSTATPSAAGPPAIAAEAQEERRRQRAWTTLNRKPRRELDSINGRAGHVRKQEPRRKPDVDSSDPRRRVDPTLHQAINRYLAGDESALPDRTPQPRNYHPTASDLSHPADLAAVEASSG